MELLTGNQRSDGLRVRTPFGMVPDDITPEWVEARATLETAIDALIEYDDEHDDLLSERWRAVAEDKERVYVAAIQNGTKPPTRPKGGYVADAEDKRPAIVGEWFRLMREKEKVDARAWEVFVKVAPVAIPGAQEAISSAADAYLEAEKAFHTARDAFIAAFSYRRDLEQYAQGTDTQTGVLGLPNEVIQDGAGRGYTSAAVIVRNAARWMDEHYGSADSRGRLPAMRRVRGTERDAAERDVAHNIALMLERSAVIEYVDGLPPESRLVRNNSARMGEAADNE
ncbi:hypothetical protein amrb99_24770 [Actinomadura sp. RB99]|uniref:hypothetical protein n=1 Tax=Actinomadura sp. RB99 TaxID=2691577 RepID=UPI001689C7B0|nr:hypothetical protein [Actinomadura sp. RB99]MBD2893555.1 hypothetical protein [Actinomadura sp. RB99]